MLECPGADDRGGDDGIMQQPCQCDIGRGLAEIGAESFKAFYLVAIFASYISLSFGCATSRLLLFWTPAEQATGQRTVDDQAHAEFATGGDHFQLEHTVVEIVEALFAGETLFVEQFSGHATFGDVPAGEVARTDVYDLSLFLQDVHGFPHFLMAAVVVDMVDLKDFEVVGLQAFEGAFTVLDDLVS